MLTEHKIITLLCSTDTFTVISISYLVTVLVLKLPPIAQSSYSQSCHNTMGRFMHGEVASRLSYAERQSCMMIMTSPTLTVHFP